MDAIIISTSALLALIGVIALVITTLKINKSKFELERKVLETEKEREKILGEARVEAKDAVKNLRKELDKEQQTALNKLKKKESEIDKRFDLVDRKQETLMKKEKDLLDKDEWVKKTTRDIETQKREIESILANEKEQLSRISGLSQEEAKSILLEKMLQDAEADGKAQIAKKIEWAKEVAEREATEVITDAMHRLAHQVTTEGTTSNITLPKEELKGKIIGKEGRNIRAFEQATGVDVVIDESPEYVVLSSFDCFRREIACRAMEKLLKDGRIHPARIEEVVREMEENVTEETRKMGEQIILESGFNDVHKDVINAFSKLRFRHSYGQNQIKHSKQVMDLCDYIATDLGLDRKLAKRCGLLHDIGKALDQDTDGTHPALGYDLAKKSGENDIVCNAIAAHHEGVEVTSIYTVITSVADAISAARPGARRESTEKYFERMEKLENIATSYKGVNKVFAMRAGRELRIAVDAGKVSDHDGVVLCRDIAKSIEGQMTYPGEIKVTLIRETRFVEFAR